MARSGQLEVCLVLAGAMHLSASLALAHLHAGEGKAEGARAPAAPVEALVAEEIPAPELEAPLPEGVEGSPAPSPSRPPRVAGGGSSRGAANDPPASEGIVLAPGAAVPGDWTFSPSRAGGANLYAGVSSADLARGVPSIEPAPAPRTGGGNAPGSSRSGGLVEGLDASDREKGLGRGGPVLSAVEDAAHTEDAPMEGAAEYAVVVRRTGPVEVTLLRADRAAWRTLTRAIADGISARHVSIPDGASGMRFVVSVDAAMRLPDGKNARDLGTKGLATTGWGGHDTPGLSSPGVPMVGVVHTGKVCSVGAAITPGMPIVGGSCSLENIGATPSRVVHGRVVSESRLD